MLLAGKGRGGVAALYFAVVDEESPKSARKCTRPPKALFDAAGRGRCSRSLTMEATAPRGPALCCLARGNLRNAKRDKSGRPPAHRASLFAVPDGRAGAIGSGVAAG